ncbi:hypothetical protein LTR85_005422 [Meristemomyces frigidus]|nr:hypothetical protein LTR85_005422 [Meristemomyces frigidus]
MESTTQDDGQASCRLLALPPELRNNIFELVLTVQPDSGDAVTISHASRLDPPAPSVLAILQTCRQVRDEAQTVFYHANHLRCYYHNLGLVGIGNMTQFNFLGSISPTRRAAIRAMTVIVSDGVEAKRAVKVMQRLPGLRSLCLKVMCCNGDERYYDTILTEETALIEALTGVEGLEELRLDAWERYRTSSKGIGLMLAGLERRLQGLLQRRRLDGSRDDGKENRARFGTE